MNKLLCRLVAAIFLLTVAHAALGDANPPGCFVGTSISISVFADSGATINLTGQVLTPGQTVYYRVTLSQAGSQCAVQGGTLTIVTPSGVSNNATPGGGIPLVCGSGTCSPMGVGSLNSVLIPYIVQPDDRGIQRGLSPCSGNPSNKVQAVGIYSGGISHCNAGDSCDPSAQITLCSPVPTGTNSWIDASGKWENSNNWSRALAPSTNDIINLITNAGNNTVTIDPLTTNTSSVMTINNFKLTANTLRLTNAFGTTFRILNECDLSNNATLLINNSSVQVDGALGVGDAGSGNQVIITNGGRLVSAAATIGGLPGFSNTVVVTGTNSLWLNTNINVNIRNSDSGLAISVANGAKAVANSVFLGNSASANGNIILVTGPGSVWSNSGSLNIGGSSSGAQFIVSNGASAFSSFATIGNAVGVNHSALVTGTNSIWVSTFTINVGNGGASNSLSIVNGGALLVTNAAHTGLLRVDGATLTLNNGTFTADNLTVTNGGAIVYAGGASTVSSNFDVGSSAGSTSTVSVTGGSLVATNGTTTIGSGGGSGSLIASNTTLVFGQTDIATGTNSVGIVTLQAGTSTTVLSNLTAGSGSGSTGTVNITGGSFVATNGIVGIGNSGTFGSGTGVGKMILQNSSATLKGVLLGSSLGGKGQLVIKAGATLHIPTAPSGCAACGFSANEGILDGGTIDSPGADMFAGRAHPGEMIVSNGVATFRSGFVGFDDVGSLTMPGGTMNVLSNLIVGASAGATGIVAITGGTNIVSRSLLIGVAGGRGRVVLTTGSGPFSDGGKGGGPGPFAGGGGGVLRTRAAAIGPDPGSQGTLTILTGSVEVYSNLVVGDCGLGAASFVDVSGGSLFVTNATGDGTLDIRDGTFTLNSGYVQVNKIVMTNSCGHFYKFGGTFITGTVQLDPNFDADGDGIPTGYEQSHGLDPLNGADGLVDSDGDGFTNFQEYQAGTDPSDPDSSPFQISFIVRQGNDVLLTWTTVGGRTNVVQVATSPNYTNNFGNLSPMIAVAGSGIKSTNYLDAGGATNTPSRFYRVKMMSAQAADDASDPGYGSVWTNGSGGGIGFSPWTLTASGNFNSNSNGFIIGTSMTNAFGTGPTIDVGGKSWGIYANGGNITAAYRTFAGGPLLVGQSLLLNMDNGFIDPSNSDGFVLRNGNANSSPGDYNVGARFEFLFLGGTNNYAVVDNAGLQYTPVPFTGTGLRLKFTLSTANTYTLQIVNNATSATNTLSGTLAGNGSVDSIAIYNRNAGAGSAADAYFNSLQIISP